MEWMGILYWGTLLWIWMENTRKGHAHPVVELPVAPTATRSCVPYIVQHLAIIAHNFKNVLSMQLRTFMIKTQQEVSVAVYLCKWFDCLSVILYQSLSLKWKNFILRDIFFCGRRRHWRVFDTASFMFTMMLNMLFNLQIKPYHKWLEALYKLGYLFFKLDVSHSLYISCDFFRLYSSSSSFSQFVSSSTCLIGFRPNLVRMTSGWMVIKNLSTVWCQRSCRGHRG